jgi:hypothetical protein
MTHTLRRVFASLLVVVSAVVAQSTPAPIDSWRDAEAAARAGDRAAVRRHLETAWRESRVDRTAVALDLADLADGDGRTAEALLWTLRARRDAPRREDVVVALDRRMSGAARSSAATGIAGLFDRIDRWSTARWTLTVVAIGTLGVVLILVGRRRRDVPLVGAAMLAVMVALVVVDAVRRNTRDEAVVVDDGVPLRGDPHAESPAVSRIPAGTIVAPVADSGIWTEVDVGGHRGFVESASILRVEPIGR